MFSRLLIPLGAVAVLAPWTRAETPDLRRVTALVAQLGSDRFAEREAASRQLDALGAPALEALRQAARGNDPETSRRARDLARRIESRLDAAKLLEPTRVRVRCEDTPFADAAAELARGGGVALTVLGHAAFRKVSLDTGDVTFWEALDRLCATAEASDDPPRPAPADDGRVVVAMPRGFGRGPAWLATDVTWPQRPDRPPELTLRAAKGGALPTHYAGAVRVRALPPDTEVPGLAPEPGDVLVVLDVAGEGTMRWQRAAGFRLGKAIDEGGRPLAARPVTFRPPADRVVVTGNALTLDLSSDEPGPAGRLVPLRLRQGDKAPTKLKVLEGTVVGQVRTPAEALVTVEDILKAAGKTVKGPRGGSVRVVEVGWEDGGATARVRAAVRAAPRGLGDTGPLPFAGRVQINGRSSSDYEELLSAQNFGLYDGKGKPFRAVRALATGRRDGTAVEYELTYQASGTAEPARFIYRDRRTVFLDVPFVLKDVPLREKEEATK